MNINNYNKEIEFPEATGRPNRAYFDLLYQRRTKLEFVI